MAIIDYALQLCDADSLTSISASGASVNGAYVLDMTGGNSGYDAFGNSEADDFEGGYLNLVVQVNTKLAGGNVVFYLKSGSSLSSGDIASIASGTDLIGGITVVASTAAGQRFITEPYSGVKLGRYVQAYIVGTANITAGKVDAWLSPNVAKWDSEIAQKFQG